MNLATIPSPTTSVWHVGPLPFRAYAVCIVLGIIAACVITERRLRKRGAPELTVLDIAVWAVPAGIIGARIYHVLTDPELYFGTGKDAVRALYIWEGGLGIWGGIAGGALGAWYACRRKGIPFRIVADAAAVGLPVAQAIGRIGNWFNNELYGRGTDLPWGLKVYRLDSNGQAITDATGKPVPLEQLHHPTFLYESLWDIGVAILVLLADRRYKLGKGRAFALYVAAYVVGRFWVETLRSDPANDFLGLRVNGWVSIIVFVLAVLYLVRVRGPQEILVADEDGTLRPVPTGTRVTAAEEGTRVTSADAEPDAGADADPDGDAVGDPPAATDDPVDATDESESAAKKPNDEAKEPAKAD